MRLVSATLLALVAVGSSQASAGPERQLGKGLQASPTSLVAATQRPGQALARPPLSEGTPKAEPPAAARRRMPRVLIAVGGVVGPLAITALVYIVLNAGLIASVVGPKQRAHFVAIWRKLFLGLWLTQIGSTAIAALVIVIASSPHPDLEITSVVLPLPLILYFTFRSAMARWHEHLSHVNTERRLYAATTETLAQAIDAKDRETHQHVRRVQRYAMHLARELGISDAADMRALEAGALLHDVGKLAVPEHILNKPSALTSIEFDQVKQHPEIGAQIVSTVGFPYPVVPIVRHHHENWDGTGYPAGLRGNGIPSGARILAVVDCFDALTSDRPYRPRLSDTGAFRILKERRGTMYDPEVVDRFVEVYPRLLLESNDGSAAAAATFDVGTALGRSDHVDAICHEAWTRIEPLMPASTCVLFLCNDSGDGLVARAVRGQHAGAIRGLTILSGRQLTGWVAAHRTPIVNSDAALDLAHLPCTLNPPLLSCLSVPMVTQGELVGVLTLYSPFGDAFIDQHKRLLEGIAGPLAALVRQSLLADPQPDKGQDQPTGLPETAPSPPPSDRSSDGAQRKPVNARFHRHSHLPLFDSCPPPALALGQPVARALRH